jgi:hypothetical protein
MPGTLFKSKTSETFPTTTIAATTTMPIKCPILANAYSAVEVGTSSLPSGVTFDTTTATFTVDTSSKFPAKNLQVTVQVTTISVTSAIFSLEVYECIVTWSL